MKTRFLFVIVLFAILLSACQPKETGFTGKWTGNVAIVTLAQNGDQVTGSVEGYGGQWTFDVAGTVSGSFLTFAGDTPLGPLAIVLSEDGKTFQSMDPTLAFCGTRDAVLPDGCGFSGKWNLKTDLVPAGGYAKLTQTGASVTGAVYGSNNAELVPLNATVSWGKGWQAEGTNDWGNFILNLTADERAFELSAGDQFGQEWCGLREGETSAYVFFFDCTIP
jgi:hypothetical protein